MNNDDLRAVSSREIHEAFYFLDRRVRDLYAGDRADLPGPVQDFADFDDPRQDKIDI
jgi:hypothetical protein